MGKKSFWAVLALCLFASPLAANAETLCPMMSGKTAMAPAAGLTAPAPPCCPKGACDCFVQAPAPFRASVPHAVQLSPLVPAGSVSIAAEVRPDSPAVSASASESPPKSGKIYKLTEQYRI